MITLISKIFIKDYHNYSDSKVREQYGVICSVTGIIINMILFVGKLFAGLISNAISVTADAFNNLSDAGSSIITLFGIKLSNQKPDPEHPFGHGRIEYITGMLVSIIILIMSFELIKTSVGKIFNPEETEVGILTLTILLVSVLFKIYMFLYNYIFGKKICSSAMKATAVDSISDSIATFVVFICSLLQLFFDLKIDGYAGVLVGLFIGYAGINVFKETLSPLLGQLPDSEFVEKIEDIVMSNGIVTGMHDLVVHDYGPGRCMVSLHAEVPCDMDILEIHDEIDNIEMEIADKLGCEISIHMDPVDIKDEYTKELKNTCVEIIREIDSTLTLHDFRVVKGRTHTNIIFDMVVPHRFKYSDDELKTIVSKKVFENFENHFCVINIDKDYSGVTSKK